MMIVLQAGLQFLLGIEPLLDELTRRATGGALGTILGEVRRSITRPFRTRTPRLNRAQRIDLQRSERIADITGDPLIRFGGGFQGPLTVFRESQASIPGLVPTLLAERQQREFERAAFRGVSRPVQPDFPGQTVADIQSFFRSLPERTGRETPAEAQAITEAIRARIE